ncbi:hypothetical protein FPZ49_23560 [Paenibacillus cremeus]|uniref:Uncharacterized protein n=1 Tax=Paenibacillus cremeus TaxID=2163881 RepID=A0A559K5T3_9BACL|nr:hypothetical protein FPZ49_23560 [Paenibacillus cremeus]
MAIATLCYCPDSSPSLLPSNMMNMQLSTNQICKNLPEEVERGELTIVVIYSCCGKTMYYKRSLTSSKYEFYVEREGSSYKIKSLGEVFLHVSRNLKGLFKLYICFKILIVITLVIFDLD